MERSSEENIFQVSLLNQFLVFCRAIVLWLHLAQLMADLLRSLILFAGAHEHGLRSLVDFLLKFCFFLLIFIYLQSILKTLVYRPGELDSRTSRHWFNNFKGFELFEDWLEISFEEISKTVFIFDGHETKDTILCWKPLLIVVVPDHYFAPQIFYDFFLLNFFLYFLLLFSTLLFSHYFLSLFFFLFIQIVSFRCSSVWLLMNLTLFSLRRFS